METAISFCFQVERSRDSVAFSMRLPKMVTSTPEEEAAIGGQGASGIQVQVDAQLRGAAGLAHQKGGHSGVLDLAHDPADRLVVDLGDVQDVLLRLLHLPQLDHTQDDVELVDELVGIGPHGLHQMAHAGELLRHGGGLGAVLEDGHRATILSSSQMGIRSDRAALLPGTCWRWTLYSGFPVVSRRGSRVSG